MLLFLQSNAWILLISTIIHQTSAVSFNLPKLCSNASWNPSATTLVDHNTIGSSVYGIFINTNNTVYVADRSHNRILIWLEGSTNFTRSISDGLGNPFGIFVTTIDDIYVDNGDSNGRVDKWASNATNSIPVMSVNKTCCDLFIDINDNLYCSLRDLQQVVMKPLNSTGTSTTIVAGTGSLGSTADSFHNPVGIFVDRDLNLYVADALNNRIQLFPNGQRNGSTKEGRAPPGTSTLQTPTGIVLDADGNLFIVDRDYHRIVRSNPNGIQCLVGCSGSSGSSPYQLSSPRTFRFDSHGNMFVADTDNNRIQKFLLETNSCDETTTLQSSAKPGISTHISTSAPVKEHLSNSHNTDAISNTAATELFKDSTSEQATTPSTTSSPPLYFSPPSCPDRNQIGLSCNISAHPCDLLEPCRNQGTCSNINTTRSGYLCSCVTGFNGSNCEIDIRPCKPNTCWNNGVCNETTNTTFNCSCQPGWTGVHCETKLNYCENVRCLNNGVCRPLLLNFTCECLGESYSGRYCEITARKTTVLKIVTRSLGYIAILALVTVVLFVIIMDLLKYVFGIDLTKDELERVRRENRVKRRKPRRRRPVIQRFVYVNKPAKIEEAIPDVVETSV